MSVATDIRPMRRVSTLGALAVLILCVSGIPARAASDRPDTLTWVDTWLHRGDRYAGKGRLDVSPVPTMRVRLVPGDATRIGWKAKNLGGQGYAHYASIEFSGCHSDAGIGFRYFTWGGTQVSWRVTHDRYTHRALTHAKTGLRIRVRAARANLRTTCVLTTRASSGGGTDSVRLKLAS
jgi:hypothetical protein